MTKIHLKQLLALLLCAALVNPLPISAASVDTNSPRPSLGSITANGSVQIGAVRVPAMSTLFSGDQVQTGLGNAVVQYREGPRVVLGIESAASFSTSEIQLQKGQMAFESSGKPVVFAASTLRLEPTSGKSTANVTLQDKVASISVSEGSVRVIDPSGEQLAALNAGDARVFEKIASPPPPPAAPAAPAQAGSMAGRGWLIGLAAGIVGASLGIAGLVRANNAQDQADAAQASAQSVSSQLAALQATNAALTTQANALSQQIASLNAFATAQKAANVDLQKLIQAQAAVELTQLTLLDITRQLDALQNDILTANQSILTQGGSAQISPTQLADLAKLQQRQKDAVDQLKKDTTQVTTITTTLTSDLSKAAP